MKCLSLPLAKGETSQADGTDPELATTGFCPCRKATAGRRMHISSRQCQLHSDGFRLGLNVIIPTSGYAIPCCSISSGGRHMAKVFSKSALSNFRNPDPTIAQVAGYRVYVLSSTERELFMPRSIYR